MSGSQGADRLRFLAMNVLSFANPDWERRRRLLTETFHRLDADVVALQEVRLDDAGRPPGTSTMRVDLLGPECQLTPFSASCYQDAWSVSPISAFVGGKRSLDLMP